MIKSVCTKVALLLLALGISGVIFSWSAGSYLTKPSPATMTKTPKGSRPVQISSESGSLLQAWLFEAAMPKAIVVLMHGKGASRLATLDRAIKFHSFGYSVLAFDFQAHGESPGDRVTLGYLESFDAKAATEYARTIYPDLPLVTVGISQGGAAYLLALPDIESDILILESVYPNLTKAVENRLNSLLPGSGFGASLLTAQLKYRIGKSAAWYSPEASASHVHIPTLVLSGELDSHTTGADSRAMFSALGGYKEITLLEGAGHVDLESFNPELYWATVIKFLESKLSDL